MEDDFFEDTALVGISSALPAYKLCWTLNGYFDIEFVCEPEMTSVVQKNKVDYYLPVFQYELPNCSHRYILYKLKNHQVSLLPEIGKVDYLWLIKTSEPEKDANLITEGLRKISDVLLSQVIDRDDLKNIKNLIV